MPLLIQENVHLVQTDAQLSHAVEIALSYDMSRTIAHASSQKKLRILNFFCDNVISQSRIKNQESRFLWALGEDVEVYVVAHFFFFYTFFYINLISLLVCLPDVCHIST